jgi:hypothetical protein
MTAGMPAEPPVAELPVPDRAAPDRPVGRRPVRIANCSGFYGDRLAAAAEMLAGPSTCSPVTTWPS